MTGTGPQDPTLVVFCRRPVYGVGKQRVSVRAGPAVALALGQHLLAAAVEDAAGWPGPVVLSPASAADRDWAAGLLQRPARVVPQESGNLGARLNHVDQALRRDGPARLLYIGSDAPVLDYAYYARAGIALDDADVVLGPAEDGGVALMGARVPWPELHDLPWSTADLGEALERRCRSRGLSVQELPVQYDVDELAQLPRLYRDLAWDPRPARSALRHWLRSEGLSGEPARAPRPDEHAS